MRLGVSAPFSGDLAEYGNAVRNGIELAKREDASLDQTIHVEYDDNKYSAVESLKSYQRLRHQRHADMMYLWGETGLQSVAPITEKERFPILSMSLDERPAQGRSWIIRTVPPPALYSELMHAELIRRGIKKSLLIVTENPFLERMCDTFKRIGGGSLVSDVVNELSKFYFP